MNTRSIVAVLLLLAAPAVLAVEQPWYVDYDLAVKQIKKANFADAEATLRHLLARKAVPTSQATTSGMWTVEYTPFFYLGEALLAQGRTADAVEAFRIAEVWGVAMRDPAKRERIRAVLEGASAIHISKAD